MTEDVKRWEGRVVEGRFPLRRYLGGSESSAVFLTGRESGQNAAIKFIAVDPATADQQLASWKQALKLSHPNLIRLYEAGQCRIDEREFLFVVMEYAEEDLSQILPQRALSPSEAQEMLRPVVGALGYLHGQGWVHGHLKPSNILASGEQVKVSSESIRKVGERTPDVSVPTVYDPPEQAKGRNSAAGDVWSLGVTLTQALTQQLPKPNGKGELRLPEGLSSPFLDIARNCLWRDPQQRWAMSEIAARLVPGASVKKDVAARPAEVSAPVVAQKAAVPQKPETRMRVAEEAIERPRWWIWALVAAAMIVGLIYLVRRSPSPSPEPTTTTSSAPEPAATPTPVPQAEAPPAPKARSVTSSDQIVERVVPNIPKSARDTVTGKVKVRVRVNVDSSGKVTGTRFEEHGPSQYFARQATQAAERWKFAPSQVQQRQWDLRFEFGRAGTQVFPSAVNQKH